jgi:hypothetical protein
LEFALGKALVRIHADAPLQFSGFMVGIGIKVMAETEQITQSQSMGQTRKVDRPRWLLLTIVFALLCLNSWTCFSIVGYENELSGLLEGGNPPPLFLVFLRGHFLYFMFSVVLAALSTAILLNNSMAKYRKFLGFLFFAMIAQFLVLYALVFIRLLLVLRTGHEG